MSKKARRRARRPSTAAPTGLAYRVFVSHASTDKWIATALCDKIESAGASTFRDDRDVKSGDDIPDGIRTEIVRSREFVVLLSPDSVKRPWVLLEAGAFWGRRRDARIIAVLCHVEIDTIPDMIRSKKAISINEFDDYVKELAGRIRVTHG